MTEAIRPSSVFEYSEIALYHLCRGCPNERGWLLMDGSERDPVCEGMLDIQNDVVGSVVKVDGRFRCPMRPKRKEPGPPDVDPRQMRFEV